MAKSHVIEKNLLVASIGSVFIALGRTSAAQGAIFTEVRDAGQTLGTAQALPGNINVIQGTISPINDADVYSFNWAGGDFHATTLGGAYFDTILALFDSSGTLLDQNDDDYSFPTVQSTINQILNPGQYLLGISSWVNSALSGPTYGDLGFSGGNYSIFLNSSTASVPVLEPVTTLGSLAVGAFGLAFGRKQKIGKFQGWRSH